MTRLSLNLIAGALLLAAPLTARSLSTAQPGDEPIFLVVNAQNLNGSPIGGVTFRLMQDAKPVVSLQTTDTGVARADVPESVDWKKANVQLVDPAWKALAPTIRRNRTSTTQYAMFRLYPASPAAVDPADAPALISAWPEVMAAERAAALPLDLRRPPLVPDARAISGLLYGSRVEAPVATLDEGTTTRTLTLAKGAVIEGRLVSATGSAQPWRAMLLFELDPATGQVSVAQSARSGEGGVFRFGGLIPGRLYRVESPNVGDGLTARSAPIRLASAGRQGIGSLPLRRHAERLTGIIVFQGEAVAGAEVRLNGGPELTTRTNDFGYFELAPIPAGSTTTIRIRRPDGSPVADSLTLSPGRDEVIVPIEYLVPAGPAAAAQ